MTDITIDNGMSYILPLETIDLSYLTKYVEHPRVERMPLWSKKSLNGESEYFEVQIVTEDSYEDCYIEPSDTYVCHICDAEVPTVCSKEHNTSLLHETFQNIFQNVLERTTKQLNFNTITVKKKKYNENLYFCIPCSKMIKIENKERHETSNYHLTSENKLKTLKEFNRILNKTNVTIEENSSEESSEDDEESVDDQNESTNNIENTIDSDDYYALQERDIPKELNIEENFENYLKHVLNRFNSSLKIPVIEDGKVILEDPNGTKIKVSHENYQSYRQIKNSVYCQLCKLWISEDTRPHDVTENHVRNMLKPVDANFYRTIDTVSSHCVICNEVVLTNSSHHLTNDEHKLILKSVKITSSNVNNNTAKTLCEVCNVYIDTHNFNGHTYAKKHIAKLKEIHHINTIDNDNLFCTVCNVNLTKQNLKSHVNSKSHLAKKVSSKSDVPNNIVNTEIVDEKAKKVSSKSDVPNNIVNTEIVDENSRFCDVCKVKVPAGGMETHIGGRNHKQMLEFNSKNSAEEKLPNNVSAELSPSTSDSELVISPSNSDAKIDGYYKLLKYTDKKKKILKCTVCDLKISLNERNIKEHMEGKYHISIDNRNKMEEYRKLIEVVGDRVKCVVCDVFMPNFEDVLVHMAATDHLTAQIDLFDFHTIRQCEDELRCDCCEIPITNFMQHINSKNHVLLYKTKFIIDKNLMRKYVYETDESNHVACRYRKLYQNLIKYGLLIKFDEEYKCPLCSVSLSRTCEIDHVLGERHASEYKKIFGAD